MNNKKGNLGIVQLPLLIGLIIVAAALPIVSKLVQKPQETRNLAAENEPEATPTCNPNVCSLVYGCTINRCSADEPIQTNCTLCKALPTIVGVNINNENCACLTLTPPPPPPITNTPTMTPTVTPTPTDVPFDCTVGDSNISMKAFNSDGTTEMSFVTKNGQLTIDDRFSKNKVILEVNIANIPIGTIIKNVGLKFEFGGFVAKAYVKNDGTNWIGSIEGSDLSFDGQATVSASSGNLKVRFPLQMNFAEETKVEISAIYY